MGQPPFLLGLGFLLVLSTTHAKLVLPSQPPRGFNTFDSYPGSSLNASKVQLLARAQRDQLLAAGYKTFATDGGWSTSQTLSEDGTTTTEIQHLDGYGRPIAAPERYPGGMSALAAEVKKLGLSLGLWTIRGVHVDAVRLRLPVKGMEKYTLDELVDAGNPGGGPNGSCLWKSTWLGVNASHPAAQAYYDSRVELLVEQGAEFIKADCFFCAPCYTAEMELMSAAVKRHASDLVLSYSPGGGAEPKDGAWVASGREATMYRTVTDFHGGISMTTER